MIMLAQLYQDLEAQVIQQEPAVAQIEQRGEEVNDNVAKVSFPANFSHNHLIFSIGKHGVGWRGREGSFRAPKEVVVSAHRW